MILDGLIVDGSILDTDEPTPPPVGPAVGGLWVRIDANTAAWAPITSGSGTWNISPTPSTDWAS